LTDLALKATLTADGSGFVGEVKNSEAAVRSLAGATAKASDASANAVQRTNAFNRAVAGGTQFMQRHRFAVQQAGFQVGDFAVQVASGQGAMRAFIQQGTQMLGVFGPMGAVLGAVVAVGGALATTLAFTGDALNEAADDAEELEDRLTKLEEVMTKLRGLAPPTAEALALQARGIVAEVAAELSAAEERLAALERRQEAASRSALGALENLRFQNLNPFADQDEDIEAAREEVERLSAELVVARLALSDFDDGFAGVSKGAQEMFRVLREGQEEARKEQEQLAKEQEREAERRARAVAGIDNIVEILQFEREQLGRNNRERAVQNELMRAELIARRANIPLSETHREAIEQEAGALFDLTEARRKADEAERLSEREREQSLQRQVKGSAEAAELMAAPFVDPTPEACAAMSAMFSEAFA
jgi:hypothetical protein